MPVGAKAIQDRYVTDVKVKGFQKQDGSWVYIILTTWSDKSRYEIYRRYADFFTFHDTLLTLFPEEAGRYDKKQRKLPYLPSGDTVMRMFKGLLSAKHMQTRLKDINYYCEQILLNMPDIIARCQYTVDFFNPLPGDNQLRSLGKPLSLHPQTIPQGSTWQEYRVIADYKGETADQLSVKSGETILVISKKEGEWWYVTKEGDRKKTGWVPSSYLAEPTAENSEDDYLGVLGTGEKEPAGSIEMYVSIADYETEDTNQVSFKEGTEISVLDKDEDGWWLAVVGDKTGWVPSSYLEPKGAQDLSDEHEKNPRDSSSNGEASSNGTEKMKHWVIKEYTAAMPDEVSLPLNAKVEVILTDLSGWWKVRVNGQEGLVPVSSLSDNDPEDNRSPPVRRSSGGRTIMNRMTKGLREPPPRKVSIRDKSKTDSRCRMKNSPSKSESEVGIPRSSPVLSKRDLELSVEGLSHGRDSPLIKHRSTGQEVEDKGKISNKVEESWTVDTVLSKSFN